MKQPIQMTFLALTFNPKRECNKYKDKRMIILYAGAYLSLAYAQQRKPYFLYTNNNDRCISKIDIIYKKKTIFNISGNLEAVRQSIKTPFDRNVITHFEAFGKYLFVPKLDLKK